MREREREREELSSCRPLSIYEDEDWIPWCRDLSELLASLLLPVRVSLPVLGSPGMLQMDEYIDILSGEFHFSNGNDEFFGWFRGTAGDMNASMQSMSRWFVVTWTCKESYKYNSLLQRFRGDSWRYCVYCPGFVQHAIKGWDDGWL